MISVVVRYCNNSFMASHTTDKTKIQTVGKSSNEKCYLKKKIRILGLVRE